MTSAQDVQQPAPEKTEYARDLQLRLYRDIGISAVAAALDVRAQRRKPIVEPSPADVTNLPRNDDLAA